MATRTADESEAEDETGREPLPAGHPAAWDALVAGTILDGLAWPGWASFERRASPVEAWRP